MFRPILWTAPGLGAGAVGAPRNDGAGALTVTEPFSARSAWRAFGLDNFDLQTPAQWAVQGDAVAQGGLSRLAAGALGAFSGFAEAAQRQRRDWADSLLYDFDRLSGRSFDALERAEPGAVIVAHPRERQQVSVYSDAERWGLSLDRHARVLSLVSPGSSALAAAVFARRTADALDEPVATVSPSRGMRDLAYDLTAPFEQGGALPGVGDRGGRCLASMSDMARLSRDGFALAVTHRLGGNVLASLLAGVERDAGSARGSQRLGAFKALRAITFGGAAALSQLPFAPMHILGGQDGYGWSISDPEQTIARVEMFAGGHLNPSLPGALRYDALLREAAIDLGFL